MFFEGSEKKFELFTHPNAGSFRDRGRDYWEGIVSKADARILSCISNESCDAYLLSESSLFVYDRQVLMITCGQTVLLNALCSLLETLKVDDIHYLTYERKNEFFPDHQKTTFDEDVNALMQRLPGHSICFGKEDEQHVCLYYLDKPFDNPRSDFTLEVLMDEIDLKKHDIFSIDRGPEQIESLGVRDLLPGFHIDDHFFEPRGYSLNAIRGSEYFTVHVTPQEQNSYVSFETNGQLAKGEVQKLVDRLIQVFEPRAFMVFLFHSKYDLEDLKWSVEPNHSETCSLNIGYDVKFFSFTGKVNERLD